MPRDVHLGLGTFRILSNTDEHFAMSITTSASISLPDGYFGLPTADQLRDEVKAGVLWVTRAGSCRLDLAVAFEGLWSFALQEDGRNTVLAAFESSPVWWALGLDLRCENNFRELPGSCTVRSYAVQHLRQAHGLVSPAHIPCAHLSALSCKFSYGAGREDSQTTPAESTSKKASVGLIKALKQLPRQTRTRPVLARKVKERKEAAPETLNLTPQLKQKVLTTLTHAGIASLFGFGQKLPGIRISNRRQCLGPLDIAPAVWNTRYFQGIVSRAKLAPFISSALGAMTNTDSSRLQEMFQNLSPDCVEELHKRTLVLILQSKSTHKKAKVAGKSPVTPSQITTQITTTANPTPPAPVDPGEAEILYASQEPLDHGDAVFDASPGDYAAITLPGPLDDKSLGYGNASCIGEDLPHGILLSHHELSRSDCFSDADRHPSLTYSADPEVDDPNASTYEDGDVEQGCICSFSEGHRPISDDQEGDPRCHLAPDLSPIEASHTNELAYLETVRQGADFDLLLACQDESSALENDPNEVSLLYATDNHEFAMFPSSWPTSPLPEPECLWDAENKNLMDNNSHEYELLDEQFGLLLEGDLYDNHAAGRMCMNLEAGHSHENDDLNYDEAHLMDIEEGDIYYEDEAIKEWQRGMVEVHGSGNTIEMNGWDQLAWYGNNRMSQEPVKFRMGADEEAGYDTIPAGNEPIYH